MDEQEYNRMMSLSAAASLMKEVADTLDMLGLEPLAVHQDSIRYELEAEVEIIQRKGAFVVRRG